MFCKGCGKALNEQSIICPTCKTPTHNMDSATRGQWEGEQAALNVNSLSSFLSWRNTYKPILNSRKFTTLTDEILAKFQSQFIDEIKTHIEQMGEKESEYVKFLAKIKIYQSIDKSVKPFIIDLRRRIKGCQIKRQYSTACSLMKDKYYADAMEIFNDIEDFKDSKMMIELCQKELYQKGIALLAKKQLSAAIDNFKNTQDYLDSQEKIKECRQAQKRATKRIIFYMILVVALLSLVAVGIKRKIDCDRCYEQIQEFIVLKDWSGIEKNASILLNNYPIMGYFIANDVRKNQIDAQCEIAEQATADGNVEKAHQWWLKARDESLPRGQYMIGACYQWGIGVDTDLQKALAWYKKSCDNGFSKSCSAIGNLYIGKTRCLDTNYEEAFKWYYKGSEMGNAQCSFGISAIYALGLGKKEDINESVKWLKKSTEQGHVTAPSALAEMYATGYGGALDKNLDKAFKYQLIAVQRGGDARTEFILGNYYYNGWGTPQDIAEATKWYEKAAEKNNADAQSMLGVIYVEEGNNWEKAIEWFKKAAAQGHRDALFSLGVCYETGGVIEQNKEKAAELYTQSFQQGKSDAFYKLINLQEGILSEETLVLLGKAFEDGKMIAPDSQKALQYYTRGALQGYPSCVQLLKNIKTNIDGRFELANKGFMILLNDNCPLEMLYCPSGTFKMGSPGEETGHLMDEIIHLVQLRQGYYIGKYEVTQSQYEALMLSNPSSDKGLDKPVMNVSWNDAMSFCQKLTQQESDKGRLPAGYKYSLPTEAQWEYACRAGTTTAFNNGKKLAYGNNLGEIGWDRKNSGNMTHSVGLKNPNAWGVYDMHGNVSEWCSDMYSEYYDRNANTIDPQDPKIGLFEFRDSKSDRVTRGGSYIGTAEDCRSGRRFYKDPNFRSKWRGFRVGLIPIK